MAQLKCTKGARVAPDSGARFLEAGAFWQAGDMYQVRLVEAVEMLTFFPASFQPLDDEAKVAAERVKNKS